MRLKLPSPKSLAITLLPAVVFMALLSANQLELRTTAEAAAARSGLPCASLADPTAGANPMPEEHQLLRQVDPDGERYLASHHVLVTPLDGPTYRGCFGRLNSNNPVGTNFIFLNLDRLNTPRLRVTALSHELVHVEHGNLNSPLGRHTLLFHLWRPEEAEAHLKGLDTANALHSKLMYPAWQDRIVWIDTLPIFYGLVLIELFLLVYHLASKVNS